MGSSGNDLLGTVLNLVLVICFLAGLGVRFARWGRQATSKLDHPGGREHRHVGRAGAAGVPRVRQ